MPIQTRSAARKAQIPDAVVCVEEGVYVRTTSPATGEGFHIRWKYDETPETPNPNRKTEGGAVINHTSSSALGATYSYSSLFDGSLPSLSLSGSSDLSDSSFESPIPHRHSGSADQTVFDTYYNLSEFAASSPEQDQTPNTPDSRRLPIEGSVGPIRTPRGRSTRPLQRTPVKHWRRNALGKLVPADEDDIFNPPPRREPASFIDPQVIFERELAKMVQQRERIALALAKTDEEDQDMDCDAAHVYLPRGASKSTTSSVGPSGTEIFGDSFGTASMEAEQSIYPQQWVERQSTGLRSFPTETL